MFAGLALLAASVFIVGAWAGVVRIWPVRYSLQLLDGLPKPFVSAPESRPFAGDSAGRLTSYAGKIEIQCPKQTERTAVILIAGQSNAANSAASGTTRAIPIGFSTLPAAVAISLPRPFWALPALPANTGL